MRSNITEYMSNLQTEHTPTSGDVSGQHRTVSECYFKMHEESSASMWSVASPLWASRLQGASLRTLHTR
jgi:hypothetical protein